MLSLHITVEESRPLFPNGMVLRSSIFKKEQHLCNQTEAQPLLLALVKIPTDSLRSAAMVGRWQQPGRECGSVPGDTGHRRALG